MIRFRCLLFSRLVRERRDRELSFSEREYVNRHSSRCDDCRTRLEVSDCALDALSTARIEPLPLDELTPFRVGEAFNAPRERASRAVRLPTAFFAIVLLAVFVGALLHR